MTLPANFWAKTRETDCLIWIGAANSKGYGCFGVDGVSQLAHRLVWEDVNGPIPDGMTIDHLCRVHNCVKIDHLELVTQALNNERARTAQGYHLGGKCGRDHVLTEASTRRVARGQLVCLECEAIYRRRSLTKPLPDGSPSPQTVRLWALANGLPVATRGRISPDVYRKYDAAQLARTKRIHEAAS